MRRDGSALSGFGPLALATLLALAPLPVTSCSDRDRLNPFDPGNPGTGGTPQALTAVAGDGEVSLEWGDLGMRDIVAFRLLRVEEATGDTLRLGGGDLSPPVRSYLDTGARNGATYLYTLFFLFPGEIASEAKPDRATPGTAVPWVLDEGAGAVVRLSPDGRDRAASLSGLGQPSDLVLDPEDATVWVSDFFNGRLVHVGRDGKIAQSLTGIPFPLALARDPRDGSFWVGQANPARLVHIAPDGSLLAAFPSIPGPAAILVDPTLGQVWAAVPDSNAVYRMPEGSEPEAIGGLADPRALALVPDEGTVWVAEAGGLALLGPEGILQRVGGMDDVRGLSLDSGRGILWIAEAGAGQVRKMAIDGAPVLTVGGFDGPYDVAADGLTGNVWVADPFRGEVALLDSSGSILARNAAFTSPFRLALRP